MRHIICSKGRASPIHFASILRCACLTDGVKTVRDHEKTAIAAGLAAALVLLPGESALIWNGFRAHTAHKDDASGFLLLSERYSTCIPSLISPEQKGISIAARMLNLCRAKEAFVETDNWAVTK